MGLGLKIRGVREHETERPQVRNSSSAPAMLGLEGMAVMAVSERDGALEYARDRDDGYGWLVSGVRSAGQAASSPSDLGSGSARRGRSVTLVSVKRYVHP